jgi:hypothetical protein
MDIGTADADPLNLDQDLAGAGDRPLDLAEDDLFGHLQNGL